MDALDETGPWRDNLCSPCRRQGPINHSWFQSRGHGRRQAPRMPNKGSLSKGLGWSSYLRVPSPEPRRGPTSAGFWPLRRCGGPVFFPRGLLNDVGSGTKTALCRLPGIAPLQKNSAMVSSAYLRQQAEILIAMSQATFDLRVAGRLRVMASEFQNRAAEQEAERGC